MITTFVELCLQYRNRHEVPREYILKGVVFAALGQKTGATYRKTVFLNGVCRFIFKLFVMSQLVRSAILMTPHSDSLFLLSWHWLYVHDALWHTRISRTSKIGAAAVSTCWGRTDAGLAFMIYISQQSCDVIRFNVMVPESCEAKSNTVLCRGTNLCIEPAIQHLSLFLR